MTVRIHFTPRDLARTTVATTAAPLLEARLSLRLLRHEEGERVFGRWRQRVRATVSADRLQRLFEQTELESLRAYHEVAIAPYWRSINAQVTTENAELGDDLATYGVDTVLSRLHERVVWSPPELHLPDLTGPDLHLGGRGIKLQLSVFCWRAPTKLLDSDGRPVLVLPVRQAPTLLHLAGTEPRRALAAVLGPTRAAALDAALVPCTTTELARRCGITPSAASYHAAILREAGLISSSRVRSTVLHHTTPLGRRLLSGRAQTPESPVTHPK
ncbi:winged helix-turn-helix domain-containing protein [Kribbella albertanoniae]|uniref:ArsR family transcriptional regulator n=1 Tax=Kribbella albertanoniae TaxID=1266829 RepID=A0A4V2XSM0_9ACTN|nr:winged helix-turn-helix domain-containing protein [Kribbella albertanoniae]TDC34155.1 ArsR family transcriptional regulator [Kribbella albertanoniae]